jgi:uncharacterized protein YciI
MKPFDALALGSLAFVLAAPVRAGVPGAGAWPTELRYVAFLRPDPGRAALPLESRQRIMDAHMANIQKMADDGVLVAAGPMEDDQVTISGIFVLKAPSLLEARRIAARDPTVVSGRNTIDVHPWMGPAGIGATYFRRVKENPGAKAAMATHAFCLVLRGPASAADGRADADHDRFVAGLKAAGVLAAAGPVDGEPDLLGIIIFKGSSVEGARKAMDADPSVRSGRVAIEYHLWWTAEGVLPW